jgi:hypothetical protein
MWVLGVGCVEPRRVHQGDSYPLGSIEICIGHEAATVCCWPPVDLARSGPFADLPPIEERTFGWLQLYRRDAT